LRELSRQAGVSQAAPYRHFKNKEALLAAISQQGFELKLKYMKESVAAAGDDACEALYACAEAYLKMATLHPEHFKIMSSSTVLPTEEHPALLASAQDTFMFLLSVVERAQKAGVLGAGDPAHRGMHCWIMVHGFSTLFAEKRLEWMGVTPENARLAMRVLVSQYINGAGTNLAPGLFDFRLFQTDYSKRYMELLMERLKPG
jgi:AcrR family transcriptional regulator